MKPQRSQRESFPTLNPLGPLRERSHLTLLTACFLLTASTQLTAQSTAEHARTGEARQQQIQSESQKLVGQLDSMIDEYDRNGITGEDAQNLKNLRAILHRLSDKEMDQVLELLRQAAQKGDAGSALKTIAQAYSTQKGMLVQMKQILARHARSQELLELSHKMEQIAERQALNLQTGIETAHWAVDGNRPKDELAASLEGQAAEQKAIAEELKILREEIGQLAKNPASKELAAKFSKALQEISKVAPAIDAASKALDEKQLFNAVSNEKAARDQMRQLARTLAPPRDEADALRAAADQMEKLIAQQKSVLDATEKANPKSSDVWLTEQMKGPKAQFYKQLKEKGLIGKPLEQVKQHDFARKIYGDYAKNTRQTLAGLENREGDIVTQSEALSQEVNELAKASADALRAAIPEMQEARAAMSELDAINAAQAEKAALAILEKAKADLQQKVAAAERAAENASDPVAKVRAAQQETQNLLNQQSELAKAAVGATTPQQSNALAQQQKALEAKASDLRAQTATDAPAASQSLANASGQMQQASKALTGAQQPQAVSAQQQAMQNLANANQQLAQQLNQLQQAQQMAAAMQQALSQLAKIIEAEQKLQIDTVQAAVKQKANPAEVQRLAPQQQSILRETDVYKQTIAAAPPAPAGVPPLPAIASAMNHMTAAHAHLQKADGTAADPEERKALEDLYALQDKLEAQMAAAQQQLGMEPPAADPQAADALAQAQAQVDQALDALDQAAQPQAPGEPPSQPGQPQAPPPSTQQAANQLEAAANTAAGLAAKPAGLPQAAQEALRDAATALGEAAAQAAAGKTPQAQSEGQEGAEALANAQAALAQAEAGISGMPSPPMPGQQPGQQPGPPGSPGKEGEGSQEPGADVQGVAGTKGADGSEFLGLPARDRLTLQQAQSEKYPQEYAGQVEQYLQNLADESSGQ